MEDEWVLKGKKRISFTNQNLPFGELTVPRQPNLHDCGVYTLLFIEEACKIGLVPKFKKELFSEESIYKKRNDILDRIIQLSKEQYPDDPYDFVPILAHFK